MTNTALLLAAFLLACWLDERVPARRPRSLTSCLGHGAASFVALDLGAFAVGRLAAADLSGASRVALLLLVFLPCLVYACLAVLWLLRALMEIARLHA